MGYSDGSWIIVPNSIEMQILRLKMILNLGALMSNEIYKILLPYYSLITCNGWTCNGWTCKGWTCNGWTWPKSLPIFPAFYTKEFNYTCRKNLPKFLKYFHCGQVIWKQGRNNHPRSWGAWLLVLCAMIAVDKGEFTDFCSVWYGTIVLFVFDVDVNCDIPSK